MDNIVIKRCFDNFNVPTEAASSWKSVIPLFEYFFRNESERTEKLKLIQKKIGKMIIRHFIIRDLHPKTKKSDAILKHYQNGLEMLRETDYIDLYAKVDESYFEDKKQSKKQQYTPSGKQVTVVLPYFINEKLEKGKTVPTDLKLNITQEFFAYLSFQKAAYTLKDRSKLESIDKILIEYIIFILKEMTLLAKESQKTWEAYVKDRFNDLIISSTLSLANTQFLQSKLQDLKYKSSSGSSSSNTSSASNPIGTFLELLNHRYRDYLRIEDETGGSTHQHQTISFVSPMVNVDLQDQINNFSKRALENDIKTNPLLVRQLRDVIQKMRYRGDSDEKIATTVCINIVKHIIFLTLL
jgi:hypothetical protein